MLMNMAMLMLMYLVLQTRHATLLLQSKYELSTTKRYTDKLL